ncbi:polysaccharide biosynthesis/export family protein [Desulfamplus magnetovallimortis]|uniref:polysaccharide biosynthesis/export family protein n=1 Tax=Desulfamplus magnetovallimortis TaxID=1246637 RepID=UPI00164607D5|nr:polysaccharide biosynthesis/export family protein [Desulfamplus magnetovallimortis]
MTNNLEKGKTKNIKYLFFLFPTVILLTFSCSNHIGKDISINSPSQLPSSAIEQPSSASSEFVLGTNDKIDITVWRNADLNRSLVIDPAGMIRIPLAGEIRASGKTVSELNQEITSRLSKYIVEPHVDVNIVSISSRKVHVMGEVNSPGTFGYTEDIPVWEALAKAGGFSDDANRENILVVRVEDGEATVSALSLDFEKLIEDGMMNRSYYLKNRDILYVPEVKIASIEKFMKRFSAILEPLISVERAIYLAPDVVDILSTGKSSSSVIVSQ